jgi:hypothetical protein
MPNKAMDHRDAGDPVPSTKRVNADAHRPRTEPRSGLRIGEARRVRTRFELAEHESLPQARVDALASCFAVNSETSVIASNGRALA